MKAALFFVGRVLRDVLGHSLHILIAAGWGLGALSDAKATGSEWFALFVAMAFLSTLEVSFSGSARREWLAKKGFNPAAMTEKLDGILGDSSPVPASDRLTEISAVVMQWKSVLSGGK